MLTAEQRAIRLSLPLRLPRQNPQLPQTTATLATIATKAVELVAEHTRVRNTWATPSAAPTYHILQCLQQASAPTPRVTDNGHIAWHTQWTKQASKQLPATIAVPSSTPTAWRCCLLN